MLICMNNEHVESCIIHVCLDETKKTLNKQWILIDALSCHEEALCFHCMYACCYESFLFTAVSSLAFYALVFIYVACVESLEFQMLFD